MRHPLLALVRGPLSTDVADVVVHNGKVCWREKTTGYLVPYVAGGAPDDPPNPPNPAGGDAQLRADLARERDERQAAQTARDAEKTAREAAERERDELRNSKSEQDVQRRIDAAAAAAKEAAKTEAEQAANAKLVPVLARTILQSARTAAIAAGITPDEKPSDAGDDWEDKTSRFLRLVDLKGLISDTADVDEKTLGERVTAAAKANPEFIGASTTSRYAAPGGPQGGGGPAPLTGDVKAQTEHALEIMQRSTRRTPQKTT